MNALAGNEAGPIPGQGEQRPQSVWRRLVGWHLSGVLLPIVVMWVALTLISPGFLTSYNMTSILAVIAITTLVGLSQVVVLAIGQFNLAIASMGAVIGMTVGWELDQAHIPVAAAIAIGLLVGCGLGFAQGWLIARAKLNPFIVTLALASVYGGLILLLTHGAAYSKFPSEFIGFGQGQVGLFPNIALVTFGVAIGLVVLVQRTVFGRTLLATGENPRAAAFSGIQTDRVVLLAHTLSGGLAAVAAILTLARLAEATTAMGANWLLPSFAAPVLGGSLLSGGKISVVGTILGALALSLIQNLLILGGVNQYWYQVGLGLLIIAAVGLERLRAAASRR